MAVLAGLLAHPGSPVTALLAGLAGEECVVDGLLEVAARSLAVTALRLPVAVVSCTIPFVVFSHGKNFTRPMPNTSR